MKHVLKLKCKNEIKADFSFRQGELWYFRLNEFETRSFEQGSIESYNGKKPEDYPHFSEDYTTEPTFYDANASKLTVKCSTAPATTLSPRDLVFETCRTFAGSQGFYGRLLSDLTRLEAENEDLSEFWEQFADCRSTLDVVMKLEA